MFDRSATRGTAAMRKHRIQLTLAAGIAVATLAVSGCASADSTTASTADCTTMTKTSLLIGTADLDVSYTPYGLLADELGYFADECLDVDIQASTAGDQALLSNKTDFVMSSPDGQIIQAETAQQPEKMVYNLIPQLNLQIGVKEGSSITTAADLKGKKIGVPALGPIYDTYLTKLLADSGATLKDITYVSTGYGVTAMESLKSGAIDAVLVWPGLWTSYKLAGYNFTLLPDPAWTTDYDGIGLAARTDYIADNPKVIEGMSRAIAKSAVYLQKFPEQAVKLFWKTYPERAPLPGADEATALKNDMAVLQATLTSMRIDTLGDDHQWGIQTLDRWTAQIAYNRAAGLITKDLDPASFFYSDQIEAANDFDHDAIKAD